ncbi:MAG: hypothetical protein F6K28_02615, partial [Microcoleus sp. SIO2G3]|nr:hypothetical protein [Microcoleus sp. SIO2G3]
MSLTSVALEEGISDMTQSWKSWSWKLGLGIAVATSAVFCGYYALAENTQEILSDWELQSPGEQPDEPGQPGEHILHLMSLTSDVPASNIYVRIKQTGATSGPYTLNPGNPVTLNIQSCFDMTVTVQLFYQVSPTSPRQFIGERTIGFGSSPPLVISGTDNGATY